MSANIIIWLFGIMLALSGIGIEITPLIQGWEFGSCDSTGRTEPAF